MSITLHRTRIRASRTRHPTPMSRITTAAPFTMAGHRLSMSPRTNTTLTSRSTTLCRITIPPPITSTRS